MKKFNISSFLLVLIMAIGISQTGHAASQCQGIFTAEVSASQAKLAQVRRFQKVGFLDFEKADVKAIVRELGVDRILNHLDVIEKLTTIIAAETTSALAKGEKLAEIGLQIQLILEKRLDRFHSKFNLVYSDETKYKVSDVALAAAIKREFPRLGAVKLRTKLAEAKAEFEQIKTDLFKARYTLGENISKLESWKTSEFERVESHAMNKPGYTLVKLSEYPDFAMALATRNAPPKPYGTGGVVSFHEYRDVVSNNLWLFTLGGHDLKHIHFANAHPLAGASIFRATRSKNNLRYFLTAALYEGVDTVQYSFETAIARHFDRQGYNLEQAMIYLVSATNQQLLDVARAIGVNPESNSYLGELRDWKPRTLRADMLPAGYNGPEALESDIINFVSRSLSDLADRNVNYFMRPELIPNGVQAPAGTSDKPGDSIHH